jgi:signal peptidase
LGYLYDVVTSAGSVLLVGLLIVAVSGVLPPLVAIESGSMEPNIHAGDLVFVMDERRFPGPGAHGDTGVVTARAGDGSGYGTFAGSGDVIVFQPGGDASATPIIHRAMFWVEEGENWYDRADPRYLGGADSCRELRHCEAPHAGFITKGDHNHVYDQVASGNNARPVRPEWVLGTAEYRVPLVGWFRLEVRSALEGPAAGEAMGSPVAENMTVRPDAVSP